MAQQNKLINITHHIKQTKRKPHDHLTRFRKGLLQNPTFLHKSLGETRDTRDITQKKQITTSLLAT